MDVWLVVPSYNEEKRIKTILNDYSSKEKTKYNFHLVIVSSSSDKTNEIVESYSSKNKSITLIKNTWRRQKGAGIIIGFRYLCKHAAKGSIVGFVDADDAVPRAEVIKMLNIMAKSGAGGAVASRYVPGSTKTGTFGILRIIASRSYNLFVRLLFGITVNDTQCGAKLLKKADLDKIISRLIVFDASIDLNILYELRKIGASVVEVPVKYLNKEGSTMNIKLYLRSTQMFIVAIGYRLIRSPLSPLFPSGLRSAIYETIKDW